MSPRATLDQARADLEAARQRLEETYYEWAGQLAREAASDALAILEAEQGHQPPAEGEVGHLADRIEALSRAGGLDGDLADEGRVLDEVLDPALEPDHDPGLAQREGGSQDYTTREDAREATEAAQRIVDACSKALEG